jgi:hypothetical protein
MNGQLSTTMAVFEMKNTPAKKQNDEPAPGNGPWLAKIKLYWELRGRVANAWKLITYAAAFSSAVLALPGSESGEE